MSTAEAPNSQQAEGGQGACPNCRARLLGPHCHQCGQRHAGRRLETWQLIREIGDHLFNAGSALPRTIRELTLDPGGVALRYVAGQRQRYVNPFKYCFSLVAVLFFVRRAVGGDPINTAVDQLSANQARIVGPALHFLNDHLSNFVFLALPLFALALRGLYRRSGFNFAEVYAFVLYVCGQSYLYGLAVLLLSSILPFQETGWRLVIQAGVFVYGTIVFFGQRSIVGALKALAAQVFYLLSIFLTMSILAVVYMVFRSALNG